MASTKEVKIEIMNVCHVSPQLDSVVDEFTLPLTFFDVLMLRSGPIERAYFYAVPGLTFSKFKDFVVPRLKSSLSTTLSHFLPLAGNLIWPPHCEKPLIQYNPGNSVLITVAKSHDDGKTSFDILSADHPREASYSSLLVPDLTKSDTMSSLLAVQVTLFPNKGFCIGIIIQHTILDGRAASLFVRAWAHTCKCSNLQESDEYCSVTSTPELTPVFNRDVIKIPSGLDMVCLKQWAFPSLGPRSLQVFRSCPRLGLLKATFKLTVADIDHIRNKILALQQQQQKYLCQENYKLSKFVAVCAHVLACYIPIVVGQESAQRINFHIQADMRTRLEPPVPNNYAGNCTGLPNSVVIEAKDLEEGKDIFLAFVAWKITCEIKKIDNKMMDRAEGWLPARFAKASVPGTVQMPVNESPRYELYQTDFSWGKPMKVDFVSLGEGCIGLADDRDHMGGIEVSMVMKEQQMKSFTSQFFMGLKSFQ